ncbi:MAG TPA: Os1348 family NHLP clan protein [Gemmatimonadales bacterium]|nr:Os1348 family NHLP clan protein [Gemmatimonadales bacterium]
MSVKELESVLHHAVSDSEFRKLLVTDPAAALASKGIQSTPERVAALKALSFPQLQKLASSFGHPGVDGIQ